MRLEEIYERFLEIEDADLNLFSRKIGGVYFWERIRFDVFAEILKKKALVGQDQLKRNKFSAFRFVYNSAKNLFMYNPYRAPSRDILFWGHDRRKKLDDGQWWDIYCDPILDFIKRSYVYVERPYVDRHFLPAKTRELTYYDFPIVLSSIVRRLSHLEFSETEKHILCSLQQRIKEKFSVAVNVESIVRQNLLNRQSELPYYQALLKKINPKLVIVVDYYGKETFIEICKKSAIPVIELQQGNIEPCHPGYSYPGANRKKSTFPDYLFVWGDFWKENTEFPITKKRVCSVGYPFLESQVKKYSKTKKLNQILFVSQGTIGSELSKCAVNLSVEKDLGYKIVYKLHPGESGRWIKDYPWLKDSGIEVIDNERVPLYQLFAQSKIQVGVYSTAIYEGLTFQLKTYLFNLPGIEYMDYLIQNHFATLVSSVDELIYALKDPVPSDKSVNPEYFFKYNSVNNIVKKIDEIIKS